MKRVDKKGEEGRGAVKAEGKVSKKEQEVMIRMKVGRRRVKGVGYTS